MAEKAFGFDGILNVNMKYEEKKVDSIDISDKPDKTSSKIIQIDKTKDNKDVKIFYQSLINEIVTSAIIDTSVDVTLITFPKTLAKLKQHFAQDTIQRVLNNTSSKIPRAIRLSTLAVRSYVSNMILKLSTTILFRIASMATIVLNIGLITLIPDILLNTYNVGGFNNEITREMIKERSR